MRMWMVEPEIMCRKHLLGEHVELHMFVGTINSHKSLAGYVKNGLVDTRQIQERHEKLAEEINKRGYKHKSPLTYYDNLAQGTVNYHASLANLLGRCPECRKRYEELVK